MVTLDGNAERPRRCAIAVVVERTEVERRGWDEGMGVNDDEKENRRKEM